MYTYNEGFDIFVEKNGRLFNLLNIVKVESIFHEDQPFYRLECHNHAPRIDFFVDNDDYEWEDFDSLLEVNKKLLDSYGVDVSGLRTTHTPPRLFPNFKIQ